VKVTLIMRLAAIFVSTTAAMAMATPAMADGCRRTGEQLIVQNRYAQVVGHGRPGRRTQVAACMRAGGDRVWLDDGDAVAIHLIRLRGAWVAFEASRKISGESYRGIFLANVRSGSLVNLANDRRRRGHPTHGRVVLRPNGSVAWIDREEGRWAVRKCERARCLRVEPQVQTVLDPGPGVRSNSLRIVGRRVAWMRRGIWRFASFR
jgi:hypothetical protein